MNRIGMRAIKSGIAIVSCYLLYIGLAALDKYIFSARILSKWFIPFMAAIVGFFSVSNSKKNLVKNSFHLWVVYFIVFLYAFLIMGGYELISGLAWPDLEALEPLELIIPSFLVCLGAVFLGYLMVIANEKDKIVNGIVLYLIIVSVKFYNSSLWESFIAGICSVSFGVLIGFLMNLFPIHFRTYDKFLFIYGTDGIYHEDLESFDYYVKYEMQELIRKGAPITLFTNRTPSSLLPLIGNLKLELPVICMGGAALYDTKTKNYLKTETIPLDVSLKLRKLLEDKGINPFISIVKDNLEYIYKEKNGNVAELRYSDRKRNNPYSNFINDRAPEEEPVFLTILLKNEEIEEIYALIKQSDIANYLTLRTFTGEVVLAGIDGYSILSIFSSRVEDFKVLKEFPKDKLKMAISTSMDDLILLNKADKVITYKNAPIEIKNKADYIIKSTRKHALIRVMKRFYYHKSSY